MADQVQVAVQAALHQFIEHLTLLIRSNQTADITTLLARPDAAAALGAGIAHARAAAAGALDSAWGGAPPSGFAAALRADVAAAYDSAAADLAQVADEAFHSVPQQHFVVGISTPGTNPVVQTAEERALAVRMALRRAVAGLGTRNHLSAAVAATRSGTEAVLAEARTRTLAGELLLKEWVARVDDTANPPCFWCRALHGVRVPVEEEFPYGSPVALGSHHLRHVASPAGQARYHLPIGAQIILTHPPRVYHNLLGPPRHPRCRCRLRLVSAIASSPVPPAQEPEPEPAMISSADIKALPEERYQGLVAFLHAALHELGQILRRLAGLG